MSFSISQNREIVISKSSSVSNSAIDFNTKPCHLVKIIGSNPNLSLMYIQLFGDIAANVSVGTTVAQYVVPLPPQGGVIDDLFHTLFFKSLSLAVTTSPTGNTAPGSPCFVEVLTT